ncbi:MAG TPA: hypothetical protein EYP19_13530, partial [Desulfobacterales bacterium]|nr:hypothetical protein [Desulfobacterales bacterium]
MARHRRFRDVRQGKVDTSRSSQKGAEKAAGSRLFPYASIPVKVKAFITDSFMLLMPIMYAVAYLVMGGLQNFAEHKAEGWLYILIPNFVVVFL